MLVASGQQAAEKHARPVKHIASRAVGHGNHSSLNLRGMHLVVIYLFLVVVSLSDRINVVDRGQYGVDARTVSVVFCPWRYNQIPAGVKS